MTPRHLFQEYLTLLNDAATSVDTQTRDVRLLRAWAVLRYILSGPMTCEQCRTQVRLAVPVVIERLSGETLEHTCLCTNCTFQELERAHRVIMQAGKLRVEYTHKALSPS